MSEGENLQCIPDKICGQSGDTTWTSEEFDAEQEVELERMIIEMNN